MRSGRQRLQNGFSAYAVALTAISRLQYRHRCTFSRISGDIIFLSRINVRVAIE
jgi:hypothetical protein